MTTFQAILLAIIEGITEFLPVSSTGHMIIAEAFMHTPNPEFTKLFTVNIQFGAILSVVVLYWKRFLSIDLNFYKKLLIAFIPAVVIGKLLDDYIDALLGSVAIVAVMLLLGGIVLLFVDKWFKHASETEEQTLKDKSAFIIGLFQCLAMIPGVSRSAATIIGGMTQKLNRKNAAEFSFFLAVPTMFAATVYKLLKTYKAIHSEDLSLLAIGNVVAFVVAILAIRSFIGFLTKHGFKLFGYYRIAVGIILLVLLAMGFDLKIS